MGTRETKRSDVFLNYHLYGEPDGPAEVDYFFWILRNEHRTIIVDTGFSPRAGKIRGRDLLLHPRQALVDLGIEPEDVADVILTHGHYDHIGNADLFPQATLHMAETEYRFWTSPTAAHTQFSYYAEQAEIQYLRQRHEEGKLNLFTGRCSPAPGLDVVEVGGHTPGQSVVRLQTTAGPVMLASDAVHFYEELERDMPFIAISSLPEMYNVFTHLRDQVRTTDLIIVPGHDPDVLRRFAACEGALRGNAVTIGNLPSSSAINEHHV
jgi:glyoxylase-like metal-dependent hydrolase (beta-lactamase superfamily II)